MRKGFAVNEDQEAVLREHGLKPSAIYPLGRGEEDISAVVRSFRGQPGEIAVAADLRIFGSRRKEILAVTANLERAGLKIVDVTRPDQSLSQLIDYALGKTAGDARWLGAKKTAKSTGRRGGKAKAVVQELRRAAIAHEDVVRRLCAHPKLTWKDREAILGGKPFTVATLRRRYT